MKIIFYITLFFIPLASYSVCEISFSKRKKQFRSFEKAQEYVQRIGVTSQGQFKKFRREGKIPKDIPSHPEKTYKGKGWVSSGHFFGTNRVANQNLQFRSFEEGEKYVQAEGIKRSTEYIALSRAGTLPSDMPSHPERTYAGKGWRDWEHFLGLQLRSFEEGKKYVQSEGIKKSTEYIALSRAGTLPSDMPLHPENTYKGKGWRGWKHFLGTIKMLTYAKARNYVINKLRISTTQEFIEWLRSDKVPMNFPLEPHKFYSEWTNVGDFLRLQELDKLTYLASKEYIQGLSIGTKIEALRWLASSDRPDSFPISPRNFYGKEWEGWDIYLGLDRVNGTGLNNKEISTRSQQTKETNGTELDRVFDNNDKESLLEESGWNGGYGSY